MTSLTRLWTWGGGWEMRWLMNTWQQLYAWMSWEDVRSTAWVRTLFILELKSRSKLIKVVTIHYCQKGRLILKLRFTLYPCYSTFSLLFHDNYFNGWIVVRYGYRPIPSEIDTAELEMLREALVSMGNDVHLLDKWYRKDTNKVLSYTNMNWNLALFSRICT